MIFEHFFVRFIQMLANVLTLDVIDEELVQAGLSFVHRIKLFVILLEQAEIEYVLPLENGIYVPFSI